MTIYKLVDSEYFLFADNHVDFYLLIYVNTNILPSAYFIAVAPKKQV